MLNRKKSYERMMRIDDLNQNMSGGPGRSDQHLNVVSTNARRLNVIGGSSIKRQVNLEVQGQRRANNYGVAAVSMEPDLDITGRNPAN